MGKLLGFFVLITLMMGALGVMFQGGQGGVTTTATAILTSVNTTSLSVSSTAGFKSSGRLVIGNEIIKYTGVTATTFTTLTRGVGDSSPVAHAAGSRVFDDVTGYGNLCSQHQTLTVQNESEQASRITLNPLTWKSCIEKVLVGNQTFLTGNWQFVMLPWYAFTVGFLFSLALAMAGLIRTVFLRS